MCRTLRAVLEVLKNTFITSSNCRVFLSFGISSFSGISLGKDNYVMLCIIRNMILDYVSGKTDLVFKMSFVVVFKISSQ